MNKHNRALCSAIIGVDIDKSIAQRNCVFCAKPQDVSAMSKLDAKEFSISGVCPTCWAETFAKSEKK